MHPTLAMAPEDGVRAADRGAVPNVDQFRATCRDALSFLAQHGFREVPPPKHRAENPFQVWFAADERLVLVQGEGWGMMASVTLEHSSGVQLPVISLVPPDARPKRQGKRERRTTQLEQVREQARWLQTFGEDFLCGDLRRFLDRATPLPPYLQPPQAGRC